MTEVADKLGDELSQIIKRRIALARLDAQADLIHEMNQRPTDIDEYTWTQTKLKEIRAKVDEL